MPTKARLWFLKETAKARLYNRLPPDKQTFDPSDELWIPRSIIENTMKFPNGEHYVTVPDWFAEKNDL